MGGEGFSRVIFSSWAPMWMPILMVVSTRIANIDGVQVDMEGKGLARKLSGIHAKELAKRI